MQYLTLTNTIIVFLIPIYLCILAYCIGYGFYRGYFYWQRDFQFFLKMMANEENESQEEIEKQLAEAIKEEELEKK